MLPLVYFYCHGGKARLAGTDLEIPVLQIGRNDEIAPGDFAAWDEADAWAASHWRDTAPLVFINGSQTAQLMPEDVVSFVDALAGVNAAGVIGTEIPVHQTIAGEVALRFYQQFCGAPRTSVGMALHHMRIDLLRKGNISGLVYTPYCSMDLVLEVNRQSGRRIGGRCTMIAAGIGALCFGLVVGWVTYRTLAQRADGVSLSDIATVIGAVGGAAVVTIFNDKGLLVFTRSGSLLASHT